MIKNKIAYILSLMFSKIIVNWLLILMYLESKDEFCMTYYIEKSMNKKETQFIVQ